jgi:hypothetical protein
MKRTLVSAGVLAVSLSGGACTQFTHSREVLAPTGPTEIPGGSSTGPLVGTFVSPRQPDLPSPTTCRNFQWQISSQSDTAIVGSFSAECGGGVAITANASGTLLNPTTAQINIKGTAIVDGLGCQFDLSGVGTIFDNNGAITIPYTGTTCWGAVSGNETLRRPQPAAPEAPAPAPNEPPPPSSWHAAPGPLSAQQANRIVSATGEEFAHLRAPFGSVGEKIGTSDELLRRIIWHLREAGFTAGRQRNPSGAISVDKVTIHADGGWHAYDILTNFDVPHQETRMLFIEVTPPSYVPDDGIPD